ncbi:lipocalin family protein [Solitalea lacus]|uniref:lipocalin family protein n=1 Tax=Solitalea lacus TaxID=2911172 RepID=UPI001EDC3A38|nr:lipocalin family protein [Solitalea lacus]UKJ08782.1 lipocalin family protein [Solitalea lacus]
MEQQQNFYHPSTSSKNSIPAKMALFEGKWYVIACIDKSLRKNQIELTKTFKIKSNNFIEIQTGFRISNSPIFQIKNTVGRIITNAPLTWKEHSIWPFKITYTFENVTHDNCAIISDAKKKRLFIIARDSFIKTNIYEDILKYSQTKGYNTGLLQLQEHTASNSHQMIDPTLS